MDSSVAVIPAEMIQKNIFFIRGKKVMLDRDLAKLYDVETKVLNQAVKRNFDRFPKDFMFQLSKTEFKKWKSQFVTSIGDTMGLRKIPFAFTEHGILMLSSVLRSKKAVQINIQIMRTFIELRKMLASNEGLRHKIELLEQKYDYQFKIVFSVIEDFIHPKEKPKPKIGFHTTEN